MILKLFVSLERVLEIWDQLEYPTSLSLQMKDAHLMEKAERAMMIFAHLSWQAFRKKQLPDADRLLILAGEQACHAGRLQVANKMREVVINHSPHHLITSSATFADALRNSDFKEYLKTVHRFCSLEQAEWILEETGIPWEQISLHRNNFWEYAEFLAGQMFLSLNYQKNVSN